MARVTHKEKRQDAEIQIYVLNRQSRATIKAKEVKKKKQVRDGVI